MHILIGRDGGEYRYAAWLREHPTVAWSMFASAIRLQPVVEQALACIFKPKVPSDWTFSTRPAEDVMADLIEAPEQLATGAVGCEVEVLCREGRFETPDDRWASIRRPPNRREVYSFGLDSLFRPQTLRAQVEKWFESQGWQTFGPPRPHRSEAAAPSYGRELLVRRGDDWKARSLCPADFPRFQPGAVISAVDEAKRVSKLPQSKSAARRAKHQENDARFKAEAVERARQRGEIA